MNQHQSMTTFPTNKPHPDYGYPESKRIDAVADSYVIGVARAADANNVSPASIYKWRKIYHVTPAHYA